MRRKAQMEKAGGKLHLFLESNFDKSLKKMEEKEEEKKGRKGRQRGGNLSRKSFYFILFVWERKGERLW